jgi:ankyrin repeat protein
MVPPVTATRNHCAVALVLAVLAAGCGDDPDASRQEERPPAGDLVRAAGGGDLATVRRLLAAGVDVDTRGAHGRTAVTAAALGEHVDVARELIRAGADVDLQDDERNNPLLVCGENGNVALLRAVLEADPDLRRTNRFGGTALIPASDRGHVAMVRALLRTDIDVDHVNRLGWTALLEAVILGDGGPAHQEIVRLLVAHGADVHIADRDRVTPLQHARRRGYAEIIEALERADALRRAVADAAVTDGRSSRCPLRTRRRSP